MFAMFDNVTARPVRCIAMVAFMLLLPLVREPKGTMPLVSSTPICTSDTVSINAWMCLEVETSPLGIYLDLDSEVQHHGAGMEGTGSYGWDVFYHVSKIDTQGGELKEALGKIFNVNTGYDLKENLGFIVKFVLCAKLLRRTYWKIYTNCSAPLWFLFKGRSDIF